MRDQKSGAQGWQSEARLCREAVSSAGELLIHERPDELEVKVKESLRDVVTELDVRVQAHIVEAVADSGYPIVGEEGPDKAEIPSGTPFWVIDPIDGTVNFINRLPLYGVSVGLCMEKDQDHFEFLTGAVYLPDLGELYSIDKSGQAVCNGEKLAIRDSVLSESLVIGGFSGSKGDPAFRQRQYEFYGAVNDSSRGCIRLGTAAVTLSWVASGRAQAAYAVNAQLWDAAGALAIAQASGCSIWHKREANVPGSTRISYVVGAPGTSSEVLKMGVARGIF